MTSSDAQLTLSVPDEHRCYAAHFPGNPLVPGALLLQWVFAAIEQRLHCKIVAAKQIKFLAIVRPGENLTIVTTAGANAQQLLLNVYGGNILVLKGKVERDYV